MYNIMDSFEHRFIEANGIKIHYVTQGEGPLVVLLHGFPEFWYAWRHQIPFLAKNFQVVAPDLRGYGRTERPFHISDYQISILSEDIKGLILALGHQKAYIVGHDWGGAIAWNLALEKPEVVDRLAVLNCPHPYMFVKALRSNFSQIRKSWYIFFFQIPRVPEYFFKLNGKVLLKNLFRHSSAKNTFRDEDINLYYETMNQEGAFTSALNYYRAAFHKPKTSQKREKISSPTMLIWGEKDVALGKELTYNMEPLFTGPFRLDYIPDCSHWANEEQPEIVNRLLEEFFS